VVEHGGWPLIGRAEELDMVAAALAKSSGSAGVVMFGNLGVGKSRFAQSLCSGAARVLYLATARADDAEMAARIARHRDGRPGRAGDQWVWAALPCVFSRSAPS